MKRQAEKTTQNKTKHILFNNKSQYIIIHVLCHRQVIPVVEFESHSQLTFYISFTTTRTHGQFQARAFICRHTKLFEDLFVKLITSVQQNLPVNMIFIFIVSWHKRHLKPRQVLAGPTMSPLCYLTTKLESSLVDCSGRV